MNEVLLILSSKSFPEAVEWYRSMMRWSIVYDVNTFVILLKSAIIQSSWDALFSILSDMRLNQITLQSDKAFIPVLQELIGNCKNQPYLRWKYAIQFLHDYSTFLPTFTSKDMRIFQQHIVLVLNIAFDSFSPPTAFFKINHRPTNSSDQSFAVIKLHSRLQEVFFRQHNILKSGEYLLKVGIFVGGALYFPPFPKVVLQMIVGLRYAELMDLLASELGLTHSLKPSLDPLQDMTHLASSAFKMDGQKHPYGAQFQLRSHTVEVSLCMACLMVNTRRNDALKLLALIETYLRGPFESRKTGFRVLNTLLITLTRYTANSGLYVLNGLQCFSLHEIVQDSELVADIYERILFLSSAAVGIRDGQVVKRDDKSSPPLDFRNAIQLNSALVNKVMKTLQRYMRVEGALSLVFLCESFGFCIDEESYILASGLLLDRREYDLVIELFELFRSRQPKHNKRKEHRKEINSTGFAPFRRWQSYFSVIVAAGEKGQSSRLGNYLKDMIDSRVELRMPIVSKAMEGLLKSGFPAASVLFFRKLFKLQVPAHLVPSEEDNSVHRLVYDTDFVIKAAHATDEVIGAALRCCVAARLGYDALAIISYSEERIQDDRRLHSHDTGHSTLNWELVVLAVAVKENIHLLPQVLTIMSYMERPLSATRRLFLVCLTASVSLRDEVAVAAVIEAMRKSGYRFEREWIDSCIDISRAYFNNSSPDLETSSQEDQLRNRLLQFLEA